MLRSSLYAIKKRPMIGPLYCKELESAGRDRTDA